MKNKFFSSKLNTVLLFILIILVIVCIWMLAKDKEIYFSGLVQNQVRNNTVVNNLPITQPTNKPNIVTAPTNIRAISAISNWKTYSHSFVIPSFNSSSSQSFSFSMKYPSDWYVNTNGPYPLMPNVTFSKDKINLDDVRTSPCLTIYFNGADSPIENSSDIISRLSNMKEIEITNGKIISSKEIEVNSRKGVEREILRNGEASPTLEALIVGGINHYNDPKAAGTLVDLTTITSCPGTSREIFENSLSTLEFKD